MSYPSKYTRQYDYVSYQNANPSRPLPAGQIHADLNAIVGSLGETIDFIKTAIRADGAVANGAIGWDQLALDVKASIGDTSSVDAVLAAKDSAVAAASAASTSATNAASSASAAASSASAASTSATNAGNSASAAATSASNAASTLANAVVGAASSTDGEIMLFSGTTGKAAKRSNSLNGTIQAVNGVAVVDAQLFSNMPQNNQGGAYTLVATDAQKHIYHSGATPHTFTIPANASVAYPVGTVITFVNGVGQGSLTIAINSDTLVLAGQGSTGSRTLAASGVATAIKVSSTVWHISGAGLT